MIPPLLRRCPECGHVGRTGRFDSASDGQTRVVVCPACGHQFEPVDQPWLL